MKKYIAFLRGINVGGHRKILMADLKKCFSELNLEEVQTYIQSGNIIFTASENKSEVELADLIQMGISLKLSFEVPVVVITVKEYEVVFKKNPFLINGSIDILQCHAVFLNEVPDIKKNLFNTNDSINEDEYILEGKVVYVKCKGKYSDTKLSNGFFEKNLKVSATTRNWKTVTKIYQMLNAD